MVLISARRDSRRLSSGSTELWGISDLLAGRPRAAFGRQTRLRASALTKRTYLRFQVDGVGEVVDATLYVRVVNRRWAPFKADVLDEADEEPPRSAAPPQANG